MRIRWRRVLTLFGGIALIIYLLTSGGDDSPQTTIPEETDTTAVALTKAEYIAEADPTCAEANAAIGQFAAAGQGVTAASEIADLRQGVLDRLNELGPPAQNRGALDAFLTAYENQIEAGRKIGQAARRGNDTAAAEAEFDAARVAAESAANRYGFSECGQPITSSADPNAVDPSNAAPSTPTTPTPTTPTTPGGGGTGGGVGVG